MLKQYHNPSKKGDFCVPIFFENKNEKIKDESSSAGVAPFSSREFAADGSQPQMMQAYPAYPADIEEYFQKDKLYDNLPDMYHETFFERYFQENVYNLTEDELTDQAIDAEVKKDKRRKKDRDEISASQKSKVAKTIALAKNSLKTDYDNPGFLAHTKKVLRTIVYLGIQYGWLVIPHSLVVKLIGMIVTYSTHKAKENQKKREAQTMVQDRINYLNELMEKTDDPRKKKNIIQVKRDFQKANRSILDDMRQAKKKNKNAEEEEY